MHLFGHQTPALTLGFRVDAGRQRVAPAGRSNGGRLSDDQAGTGALPVIGGHQLIRDVTFGRPRAGYGGHDSAVLERDRAAQQQGVEQVYHETSFDRFMPKVDLPVALPIYIPICDWLQMKILKRLPGLPAERALKVL